MKRLALALAALLIAAFAVTGVSAAAAASAAPADSLYALVNQERAANGLPPLARNASIEAVAVNWANQMAASGTLGHNPEYSGQLPGGWTAAAENVAQGQPTAERMHADWMNSPGHRANILGDFTAVGIAFVRVDGTTWGVQNFAKYAQQQVASPSPPPPVTPATPSASPAAPKPAPAAPTTAPTATPAPTPTATPTPTPQSETQHPAPAEEPTTEASAGLVPGSDPSPDVTNRPAGAVADQAAGNPAGVALLGLALTAAVTFIIRSARCGRWGRHRR